MSWALGKRLIIVASIGIIILIVGGTTAFFTLHKAPSCMDNVQNRDEEGIDCGGNFCTYLCATSVNAPSVSFARAISQEGRTDVIAYVENPNATAAAKHAAYTVELYGADHSVLATRNGIIDLPPGEGVPIFISNMYRGAGVTTAFLSFKDESLHWYTFTERRLLPYSSDAHVTGSLDAPRVTATMVNRIAAPLANVPVIATLYDATGNAIAASQTIMQSIAPQGTSILTFTWNQAFTAPVTRIDVRPLIQLP